MSIDTKQTQAQAIEKIVNFWAEKAFKTQMNQNNGDDSSVGGITFMLMNMASSNAQEIVTDEKIELFEKELTRLIVEQRKQGYGGITLSVDYHPCNMLSDAATVAGLDSGCFPCKTITWLNKDNTAEASYQYGGKMQTL